MKQLINQVTSAVRIPTSDLLSNISSFFAYKWQQSWDSCLNNKFPAIIPILGHRHHSTTLLSRQTWL